MRTKRTKKAIKKKLPIFMPNFLCTIDEMSKALGVNHRAVYARRARNPHIYTLLDIAVFCKLNKLDNDFLRNIKVLRDSH